MEKNKDIFLGIDPSLSGTGIIYIQGGEIIKQKLIKSKPRGKEPIPELERMMDIIKEIMSENLISKVSGVCLEGPAFMCRNTTSLVQLGYLNYRIREELYNMNIPFTIVPPTSLKKFATGKGNAKKDLVLLSVYKKWNVYFDNDNLADAFVLAKIAASTNNSDDNNSIQLDIIKKLKINKR